MADAKLFTQTLGDDAGIAKQGWISSRDYNRKMRGRSRIDEFDKMRLSDGTIRGLLSAIKLPIKSANWRIEPASDDERDIEIAAEVENQLFEGMTRTFEQTLNEILLYLDYGSMPFEIIFEIEDGKVKLKKLGARFPDTILRWKTQSGEEGIHQMTINGNANIPMKKLVVFVNEMEGSNWEGISLLRPAYRHWFLKDKYLIIDSIAQERHGLGIPMANIPTGMTPEEKDKVKSILRGIKANEKSYLMNDMGVDIEMLDMKTTSLKDPKDMVNYHDQQMAVSVLGQFLLLGADGKGSYALSRDHSELFILSLESIAKHIASTINKYVVKKIVDFNYEVEDYPKLTFDEIGNADLEKYSLALERAAKQKFIDNDEAARRHVRDLYGLPATDGRKPSDDDVSKMISELQTAINKYSMTQDAPELESAVKDARQLIADMEAFIIENDEMPEAEISQDLLDFNRRKNEILGVFDLAKQAPQPASIENNQEDENEQEQDQEEREAAERSQIGSLISKVRTLVADARQTISG